MKFLTVSLFSVVFVYSSMGLSCADTLEGLLKSAENIVRKNLVGQPSGCLAVAMNGASVRAECPLEVSNTLAMRIYPIQLAALAQCNQCGPKSGQCRNMLDESNIKRNGILGLKAQLQSLKGINKVSFDSAEEGVFLQQEGVPTDI